ncbi:MAG: hypothetical protein ACLPZR_28660 [Solirubrobacteraceae bacterium]
MLVFATLGAPERRRLAVRRRRKAEPQPNPTPVRTGRATVIDAGHPMSGADEANAWLRTAGEADLAAELAVLNRALHAFRLVAADPHVHAVQRRQALVARLGFGVGEQVADGLWTSARELGLADGRQRRSRALAPQARLAAVLGARERLLACEELVLRARTDVDEGRYREAALQVLVALDAALAELGADRHAAVLADRLTELRAQRGPVAAAAQAALSGGLDEAERRTVSFTVSRIEAVLRARAATAG